MTTFSGPIKVKKNNTDSEFGVLLSQQFLYTQNATAVKLTTLPPGSRMIRVILSGKTAFGSSGTLSMGNTATATEYFSLIAPLAATSSIYQTGLSTATTYGSVWNNNTTGEVWAKSSTGTGGDCIITILYMQVEQG